jgi:hypothetical protein
MTGGELMLKMLDLNYNAVSRTYQASLQLKSTGGVFIVDDLGRQEEPPQALINRWIVPMEAQGHPRPAIGREVRSALRHARGVLHELPSQRDLRPGRASPDLLQGEDRRPEPERIPQDLRHGRPQEEACR